MTYKLQISPKAWDDISKGASYYNEQQKGLGKRFRAKVKTALDDIREMPLSASIASEKIRYKVVDKFPYVIFYEIDGNIIYVARVFNTHQRPIY